MPARTDLADPATLLFPARHRSASPLDHDCPPPASPIGLRLLIDPIRQMRPLGLCER